MVAGDDEVDGLNCRSLTDWCTASCSLIDRVAMGTKDCGRWALYGSSEVAGVLATGGPVAGVLVAGGVDRFPSCGNCSRALTSMCTWLLR